MFGLTLDETARLHGHKGPWLVLGYKAGMKARDILKPATEHDLYCIVYLPLKTPFTCIIDGLQGATGCTLGKLNIEAREADEDSIKIVIKNRKNDKTIEFRLKKGVSREIREKNTKEGLERSAKWVERENLCQFFEEKLYD